MKPEALNADVFLSMQNALTALSLLIRKLEKLSANNRLAYQEALSNARTLKEQLSKNLHAYVSGEIDTTAFTVCCHINLLNARLNNRNRFFDEWSSFLNSVQSLYYRSSSDIGWKNSESEQLSTLLRESNSYKLLEKLLSNYPDNGTLFCLTYPDSVVMLDKATPKALRSIVQHFNTDKLLIIKCYKLLPDSIQAAEPQVLLALIKEGSLGNLASFLTLFADNAEIVGACFDQSPHEHLLRNASPEVIIKLMQSKGASFCPFAVKAFANNHKVVRNAYAINPASISHALPATIVQLVEDGSIPAEKAKTYLKDFDLAALVAKSVIRPESAKRIFPENPGIIHAAYLLDKDSIAKENPAVIAELVKQGLIAGVDAIQCFPKEENIILNALGQDRLRFVDSETEAMALILAGKIDPMLAVRNNPSNSRIIEAAYQMNPAILKLADKEVINTLGRENKINIEDVLELFALPKPKEDDQDKMRSAFLMALYEKNWEAVLYHCDKFWFEKPPEADRALVAESLYEEKNWSDLYAFEQEIHKKSNATTQLVQGPLEKTAETYQLEALSRKLMLDGTFTIETRGEDDYFVFQDNTAFNWTQIRLKANWQHIFLEPTDHYNYYRYIKRDNPANAQCTLNLDYEPAKEEQYRQLFYNKHEAPSTPICYAEMQAINIYTGGFYTQMNGIMRDAKAQFDYKKSPTALVRAAIIHSVMCASGINKAPRTDISSVIRHDGQQSNLMQRKIIKAAASTGLIKLEGFVSASNIGDPYSTFSATNTWNIRNLKGIDLACVSQNPHEAEFLIPPTELKILSYSNPQHKRELSTLEASQCTTPGNNPANLYMLVPEKTDSCLLLADSQTVISMVQKGSLEPGLVLELCASNKELCEACRSLERNPFIDNQLVGIRLSYEKNGSPAEAKIRQLIKGACKADGMNMHEAFSTSTPKAIYIIDKLKSDKKLCEAFGITVEEPLEAKIKAFMQQHDTDVPQENQQQPGLQ